HREGEQVEPNLALKHRSGGGQYDDTAAAGHFLSRVEHVAGDYTDGDDDPVRALAAGKLRDQSGGLRVAADGMRGAELVRDVLFERHRIHRDDVTGTL